MLFCGEITAILKKLVCALGKACGGYKNGTCRLKHYDLQANQTFVPNGMIAASKKLKKKKTTTNKRNVATPTQTLLDDRDDDDADEDEGAAYDGRPRPTWRDSRSRERDRRE